MNCQNDLSTMWLNEHLDELPCIILSVCVYVLSDTIEGADHDVVTKKPKKPKPSKARQSWTKSKQVPRNHRKRLAIARKILIDTGNDV